MRILPLCFIKLQKKTRCRVFFFSKHDKHNYQIVQQVFSYFLINKEVNIFSSQKAFLLNNLVSIYTYMIIPSFETSEKFQK